MSSSNNSNGRVNILGPNIEERFSMSDKIPINSSNYSFREALPGNWNDTKLSIAFFSYNNMQIIQNGIRAGVYNKSNKQYVIGEQSIDELKIIMHSMFLEYSKNLPDGIPQQINDIRNNSTRIEQIFDGVKHLIPNSETVSPNSSNLEEILDAITIEIN